MGWPKYWERIDDILTPGGIAKLQIGQVLMFNFEGSRNDLKVMKITKTGAVWAKRITTYDPDDVTVDGEKLSEI